MWEIADIGEYFSKVSERGNYYNFIKCPYDSPITTITAQSGRAWHPLIKRPLNKKELILASSFPQDFDFFGVSHSYVLGMSVPPIMVAQVATEIYNQWLKNL